ncbi:MAG: 6-phosphogluconolactonase [Steroidobacteraceae bacterium]|jgi:6-phosphogluconolactonase
MSKVHYDIHEHRFAQAATLTQALAARIAEALQSGLAAGRGASLAVPGGHTPIALFERLSSATLDWDSVWITLTDERWVDVTSASSNEALVRTHLLRQAAASAQFVGLKSAGTDVQTAASASWSNVAEIPRPFDLMLLGMGDDGHVASLFPDSPGLPAALDLSQPPGCVAMHAPVAPHARISLNLRALLDSRQIVLLIEGKAKWDTLQRARVHGAATEMPVRALLQQQNVPVSVYWSP